MCVKESVLCSVIEIYCIYLFMHFLSSNLHALFTQFSFKENTPIVLVDFLVIFLLGDEKRQMPKSW